MKTKFKDVAHFYMGCKGYLENRMYLGTPRNGETLTTEILNAIRFDGRKFTPILKPITDITFELFKEFAEEVDSDEVLFHSASKTVDHMELSKYMETQSKWIAFLCSRGYNVFGLDESEIITKP